VLSLWSLFTILTGMAQSFWALLCARAVVGAAEGGGPPTMLSILSDSAPPKYRPATMSIFFTGPFCGILLGSLLGGFVADLAGWRMALFAAGIPGLVIAAVLLLLVREPRRGAFDPAPARGERQPSTRDSLRALVAVPSRAALAAAIVL